MALNEKGRIAVFATLGQALGLTWALRVPYIAMAYLLLLPWLVTPLLGLFEPFQDMAVQPAPGDPAQAMEHVPILPFIIIGVMTLAITSSSMSFGFATCFSGGRAP